VQCVCKVCFYCIASEFVFPSESPSCVLLRTEIFFFFRRWAVRLRIVSRFAPLQAWTVFFPFYRSMCEATVCRLANPGKVKCEGVAPRFPFGFWFSCLRLVFLVSSHQLLGSLAGRTRSMRLHLLLFSPRRLRRRPGYVLRQSLFRSLYFQIEVSVMFYDDPRRLPSVCLGRDWYVRVYLPVGRITLFCLHESNWCIWLQYCFLSYLYFTHDKCHVRPTIMLTVIRVFWSTVGLSICVVSLHGPIFVLFVVLILWSAVLPCTYCKLTLSRWVCVCIP